MLSVAQMMEWAQAQFAKLRDAAAEMLLAHERRGC